MLCVCQMVSNSQYFILLIVISLKILVLRYWKMLFNWILRISIGLSKKLVKELFLKYNICLFQVYLAENRNTKKQVAVKVVPKVDSTGFITKGIVEE